MKIGQMEGYYVIMKRLSKNKNLYNNDNKLHE